MERKITSLAFAAVALGGLVLTLAPSSFAQKHDGGKSNTETRLAALEAKVAALEAKLQYLTVSGSDMVITGANLHIRNGAGWTGSTNGTGNLVIGYNEGAASSTRTGSHNVVLATYSSYTSYGSILSGDYNQANGPFATLLSCNNVVASSNSQYAAGLAADNGLLDSAFNSMVSSINSEIYNSYGAMVGGSSNQLLSSYNVMVGGSSNKIQDGAMNSVALGGHSNQIWGDHTTITGGHFNKNYGNFGSIVSGYGNQINNGVVGAGILGGSQGTVQNNYSNIGGGTNVTTSANMQFKTSGLTG